MLRQIPEPWRQKLFDTIEEPLKGFDSIPTEGNIDVIYHPPGMEPKFLNIGSLARDLHQGTNHGIIRRINHGCASYSA